MSELDGLFSDENKMIDGLLRQRLEPLVGLSRDSDRIVAKPPFLKLSYRGKLVTYLAARHAMVRAGIPGATLEVEAPKAAQHTFVPLPRCREQLSRLKAKGLVESNEQGYFIPGSNLLVALEELGEAPGSHN